MYIAKQNLRVYSSLCFPPIHTFISFFLKKNRFLLLYIFLFIHWVSPYILMFYTWNFLYATPLPHPSLAPRCKAFNFH